MFAKQVRDGTMETQSHVEGAAHRPTVNELSADLPTLKWDGEGGVSAVYPNGTETPVVQEAGAASQGKHHDVSVARQPNVDDLSADLPVLK